MTRGQRHKHFRMNHTTPGQFSRNSITISSEIRKLARRRRKRRPLKMPPGRGRLTRLHNDCMEAGTFSAFLVASTRAFVSAVTAKYTVDLARNGAMLAGEDPPINRLDRRPGRLSVRGKTASPRGSRPDGGSELAGAR